MGNSIAQMKAAGFPFLQSEDIATAIRYVLGTPAHVQVITNLQLYCAYTFFSS